MPSFADGKSRLLGPNPSVTPNHLHKRLTSRHSFPPSYKRQDLLEARWAPFSATETDQVETCTEIDPRSRETGTLS